MARTNISGVVKKKTDEESTQKQKHMAFPWVVNGSCTQRRQLEMDWVNHDGCLLCGKEGSEYHRLFECVAQQKYG